MLGAAALAIFTFLRDIRLPTFIIPMWLIAIGMVMIVSVTANGALQEFDEMAGTAVALYFAIESLIVSIIGTGVTFVFGGDNPWPLVFYCFLMCAINIVGFFILKKID